MSNERESSDSLEIFIKGIGAASVGLLFAAPLLLGVLFWKNPENVRRLNWKLRVGLSTFILTVGMASWYLWLDRFPLYSPNAFQKSVLGSLLLKDLIRVPWLWWSGSGLVLLLSPLILLFKPHEDILRLKDFRSKPKADRAIKRAFLNPASVPIGVNVKTGEVEVLEEKRRCSHVLTIGATGSGKSTLMYDMILHAVRHNQPAVVIDPKGEMGSLQRFLEIAKKLDPNFENRFRLFSMGSPDISASYNPLKNGNAIEKKDRILEALNWSEQFYQSMSGSYLSALLSGIEITETHLTLDYLEKVSIHKPTQSELLQKLAQLGKSGSTKAEGIFRALEDIFKRKGDDLLGLQAQISILNNPTMGPLLSIEKENHNVDLREVLEKNQIAYFQLNTLGNADTARRLGRMIIEDVKSLAHHVYNTVSEEKDRKFFPVFIDEFGSFAAREFIELLKQVRGAKFAIHMFCQGLEDLDAVSPEFRRQSISNPMTTISLRVVDNETVNEVAATAGTIDSLEQSYQVQGDLIKSRTGMGNQRETKQMRVEHDVLRNLDNLQAVIIKKSPSEVKGIQIFFPEVLN